MKKGNNWRIMKRIGNLYDQIYTRENAELAFENGTAKKKTHPTVRVLWRDNLSIRDYRSGVTFKEMLDPDKYNIFLNTICSDLANERYQMDKPRYKRQFCTSKAKGAKGKWRDLWCPSLRDHVMQHMLMQVSMPVFTKGMYRWCCGNVPGRGGKTCVDAITDWCKNDHEWRYFVELDIRKFFDNIKADDVMAALRRKCKDERILALHEKILHSAPVPVPVGYFTSPWYANFLLEPLDHYIVEQQYKTRRGKRKPTVRHYIRYVDNMLLMGSSKRELEKVIHNIEKYLFDHWGLTIKQSWEIKKIAEYDKDGKLVKGTYRVQFIGYSYDRTRTIMREGNFLSTRRLAHRMRLKAVRRGESTLKDCLSYMSKRGFASPTDHRTFDCKLDREFPKDRARRVISNAAKSGIHREAGAL